MIVSEYHREVVSIQLRIIVIVIPVKNEKDHVKGRYTVKGGYTLRVMRYCEPLAGLYSGIGVTGF